MAHLTSFVRQRPVSRLIYVLSILAAIWNAWITHWIKQGFWEIEQHFAAIFKMLFTPVELAAGWRTAKKN